MVPLKSTSIIAVALVALVLALTGSVVSVFLDDSDAPSEAEALALRMDALLDSLPAHQFEVFDPVLWTYEIVPYFEYEGLTSRARYPDSAQYTLFPGAGGHFHVLGKAQCDRDGGGPIFINARGLIPESVRFGETWLLPTLIHELIHAQGGGFCSGSSESLESTTQMATLEVLAAMANHGNVDAVYALIDELRDMAMAAVYYEALRDNRLGDYYAFRDRIYTAPLERARSEKSRRFWFETAQSRANLKEILNKYNFIPISRVLEGLKADEPRIENLYLGEWVEYGRSSTSGAPDKYAPRSLKIDDLAYFLEHVEAIVAELGTPAPPA